MRKGKNLKIFEHEKPDMVFCDEVHTMMCRDADKFKALKSCCENVDRVHLVSGTPMRNDSGSIWSLLLLLGVTDGLGCGGFSETEFSRLFLGRRYLQWILNLGFVVCTFCVVFCVGLVIF